MSQCQMTSHQVYAIPLQKVQVQSNRKLNYSSDDVLATRTRGTCLHWHNIKNSLAYKPNTNRKTRICCLLRFYAFGSYRYVTVTNSVSRFYITIAVWVRVKFKECR